MKNVWAITRKTLMLSAVAFLSAFILASCSKDDDEVIQPTMYTVTGSANGGQMVPAVTTDAAGTISGTYNRNTRVLNYTTNWTNLSGAPTMAGFYSGAAGAEGTPVGSAWTLGTDVAATGTVQGEITLTEEQAEQLLNGNMYYTIGTANNSAGEIRGQISTSAQ